MKIAIDATAQLGRRFGIGQYADRLIHALSELPGDHDFQLVYNCLRDRGRDFRVPADGRFKRRMLRLPMGAADMLLSRMPIPADVLLGFPDVFHATRNFLPVISRGKSVWTCHDVAFKVNPDWFPSGTAARLDEFVKRALDRADHVIAVSENTRNDLVALYGYPEEKVTRIHEGSALPTSDSGVLPRSIPTPYILFVGTLEPRKNVARLVEAYSRLTTPHALVLVGARGWNDNDVFRAVSGSVRRDRIVWLDYVDPAMLGVLYRNAAVFVYPSLYEGFGIPVLEAMSQGCPVVTSSVSSLPELGGDAVLYADPMDEIDLAEKIRLPLEDSSLRAMLATRGRERSALFSWRKTAEATLGLYERMAGAAG